MEVIGHIYDSAALPPKIKKLHFSLGQKEVLVGPRTILYPLQEEKLFFRCRKSNHDNSIICRVSVYITCYAK